MLQITKRDGRVESFDSQKIVDAVLAAFQSVDGEISDYAKSKAHNIATYIEKVAKDTSSDTNLSIEDIQNLVINGLMSTRRKDVARAYVEYRHDRATVRKWNNNTMQGLIDKLFGNNIENSNANTDENSFGGRRGEAIDVVLKQFALDNCMSKKSKFLHEDNQIYIHDLSSYALGTHNCLTCPVDELLAKGFNTRQTDIRPANSINTAFQLIAVIFQLQSLVQFGGVSASHLDWTMVPYVRKSFYKHYLDGLKYCENFEPINKPDVAIEDLSITDSRWYESDIYPKAYKYAMDMTTKETEQAVEGMLHNLNTLQSRSGDQLPFSSINFGTCTLIEGRMVIKALLEGSLKGVGKLHKTPIFPCSIWQSMDGVNQHEGEPNYDLFKLALKSTAKRLYPNYCNVDWSVNAGYDRNDPTTYMSTMGCRTYNGADINAEEGVNPQRKDGRGNLAPVTIILPKIAMIAKEITENKYPNPTEQNYKDEFLTLLEERINDAKDMLLERYKYLCSQKPESARFMYENNTMFGYKEEEGIESALKHGTLVVGQIGLSETLYILLGCNHLTDKGMEFAKEIESLFNKKCKEFKEKLHLNFGVYYSPAESLCYTAMTKFKKEYGIILNVSENEFFTNSIHVPVWEEINPFEKIDIESQLTGYSNAGCITYTEFDSSIQDNLEALEEIVLYAMKKDIPYFAVNVPSDTCLDCGFQEEINGSCPKCGGDNIQRLRRVTGYLTGDYKTAFNKGKQQETEMRFKHGKLL